MTKRNKHPPQQAETELSDSENSIENIKYILKLKLQSTVLKKLLQANSMQAEDEKEIEQENLESN